MEKVGDIYDLGEIPQEKAETLISLVIKYNESKKEG
jgi:hypothetical protein